MDIDAALARACEKRRALGLPNAETNAYRLVHGAADALPGLTVDVYDEYLVASFYTEERGAREAAWLRGLITLGFRGIYVKARARQANALGHDERKERAPEFPVHGDKAPDALIVREHGVPFAVRLGDGFSTGLFLDQRDNRANFARAAVGGNVLNLFAYTCAFGVVAARGGALATTNIDIAKPALERGKQNYVLAGLLPDDQRFLARDVVSTLPRLLRRGQEYDLIALDPPSYASGKGTRFSAESDYGGVACAALALLRPGGTLLACTNHARISEAKFAQVLRDAAYAAGRGVRELQLVPPPADHPTPPGQPAHLKSAWVRV